MKAADEAEKRFVAGVQRMYDAALKWCAHNQGASLRFSENLGYPKSVYVVVPLRTVVELFAKTEKARELVRAMLLVEPDASFGQGKMVVELLGERRDPRR